MIILSALNDNYITLYEYAPGQALAVDPGDDTVVFQALKEHELQLTAILLTHHHGDHTGGVKALKHKTDCAVYGPNRRCFSGIDHLVEGGQSLSFGNRTIDVIHTPGHTAGGVCYYLSPSTNNDRGLVWTGDTLFVGGCGRLFEGSAEQMYHSLQTLAALPDETLVYCGHEYTLDNYEFALSVEPDNEPIQNALDEAENTLRQGDPTVPSTIKQEKRTNLFVKARTVDEFAQLRQRKDRFCTT
jgi:hydroxyacylglutathione hydrolase